MGGTHRANRRERASHAPRPRTRNAHPKLSDPIANTNLLNARLRSLGLYAAPTLGDGNCLFRALSDQLYGSHSKHLELRREICDFVESRKEEYAGFIDDEQGIDAHLTTMRRPGEYGGHVELSVFARLKRRDVKVIQPDVCYVIEHKNLFTDDDELEPSTSSGPPRRKNPEPKSEFAMTEGTIYVAYHDWEHFSSVRNLKGPHHGLPNIQEQQETDEPEPVRSVRATAKPTVSKHKLKALRGKVPINSLLSIPSGTSAANNKSSTISTQATASNAAGTKKINIPPKKVATLAETTFDSRESSPLTSLSQSSSSSTNSNAASGSSVPSSLSPVTPPDGQEAGGGKPQTRLGAKMETRLRSRLGVESGSASTTSPTHLPVSRSPKRTFGESDLEDMSEEKDGSVEGRRIRRRSRLASPENLPSSSLTREHLALRPRDEEDDDEDRSVLRILNDDDEEEEEEEEEAMEDSDSSLSPPPPDPIQLRTKTTRVKAGSSKYLHPPNSQASDATAPPSSVSPSLRPSPAPFEESSQDTTTSEMTSTTSVVSSSSNTIKNISSRPTIKLTRRQRKALGLPKSPPWNDRPTVILIPGGKHPSRLAMRAAQERDRVLVVKGGYGEGENEGEEVDEENEVEMKEWEKNGSGRKDSRGFVVINI